MDWLVRLLGFLTTGVAVPLQPAVKRSSRWPAVRAAHLLRQPECQACGTTKNCEVHHLVPVHVDADKELSPENLLTVCRSHHFTFCHCEKWESWNPEAVVDVAAWRRKLAARP